MKFIYINCILPFLFACSSEQANKDYFLSQNKRSSIIFILDSTLEGESWINLKAAFSLEPEVLKLDKLHYIDSVTNVSSKIMFSLGEIGNTAYNFEYFAFPGDTIKISYDSLRLPIVKISGYSNQTEIVQNIYHYIYKRHIGINSLIAQEVSNLMSPQKEILPDAESSLSRNLMFLDSLEETGLITSSERIQLRIRQYGFLCSYHLFKNNTTAFKSIFEKELLPNNDLIDSNFYYKELFIKYAKLLGNIKLDKDDIDYRRLAFNDYSKFSNTLRDYLLFYSVTKAKSYQPNDFNEIKEYFINTSTDSLLKKHFFESEIPISKISNVKSEVLFDTKSNAIQLDELLEKYKGNVVYIDFWASWCAPCIAEMPSSKSLREKYKNQDVVFIFLSIDNSFKAWLNSQHRLLIDDKGLSFVLSDSKNSKIIKSLKLSSIPRYIIYNKKGVLINSNAPSPSEMQKTPILDRLLNEQ